MDDDVAVVKQHPGSLLQPLGIAGGEFPGAQFCPYCFGKTLHVTGGAACQDDKEVSKGTELSDIYDDRIFSFFLQRNPDAQPGEFFAAFPAVFLFYLLHVFSFLGLNTISVRLRTSRGIKGRNS
jgi:hypothetical protein